MCAGGGSLMNQGVHNVDLLRWLCGPVTAVTAQYGTLAHDIEAEDTTVATLRFANGALGMISTSTATPPGSPATITLHLDRGVVELGQGEVRRWDRSEEHTSELQSRLDLVCRLLLEKKNQ